MNKKVEKRNRYKVVYLRFTENEYEFFDKVFKASKCRSRNDFIIELLRNSKIINFNYDYEILRNFRYNLSQIGNNINQIARRVNTLNLIYKEDVEELRKIYQSELGNIGKSLLNIEKKLPKKIREKRQ